MEFTLRQARNLESRLRSLSIKDQVVSVRAYDSGVARFDIEEGVKDLQVDIADKLRLIEIRHTIKHLINTCNMECGVSKLLNSRDLLWCKKDILNTIKDPDDVDRQVAFISENPGPSRLACMVSEETWDDAASQIDDIEQGIRDIAAELNELNNTVCISLSIDDATILQENGLV